MPILNLDEVEGKFLLQNNVGGERFTFVSIDELNEPATVSR